MALILIADDETKIRDSLKNLLSRDHEIQTAKDWPDLLEKIDQVNPDLVVTDIVMPGYKDMIKQNLSDLFSQRKLPVLFMSGYAEQTMKNLPDDQRFVTKPFSLRVVQSYVKILLKDAGSGA